MQTMQSYKLADDSEWKYLALRNIRFAGRGLEFHFAHLG